MVNKRAVMVHAGDGGLAWALWNDGMDVWKMRGSSSSNPSAASTPSNDRRPPPEHYIELIPT